MAAVRLSAALGLALCLALPAQAGEDEFDCLARTVYWEARGESALGQRAVAHVVLNRAAAPAFPAGLCAVVRQTDGAGRCQFAWWCERGDAAPADPAAWEAAKAAAARALAAPAADPTGGALFFQRADLPPPPGPPVTVIGRHVYF